MATAFLFMGLLIPIGLVVVVIVRLQQSISLAMFSVVEVASRLGNRRPS